MSLACPYLWLRLLGLPQCPTLWTNCLRGLNLPQLLCSLNSFTTKPLQVLYLLAWALLLLLDPSLIIHTIVVLTPNCLDQISQALHLSLASTNTPPSPSDLRYKVPLLALTVPPDSWAHNQTPWHPFFAINYTPLALSLRLPVFRPLTWSGFHSSISTVGPLASDRLLIPSITNGHLLSLWLKSSCFSSKVE